MPTFLYKAKSRAAETVDGRISAANREEALEKIHRMNLIPVSIREAVGGEGGGGTRNLRVRASDLFLFSRQLVRLLRAGMPLLRALEVLAAQTKSAALRKVIRRLADAVRGGSSFSEGLAAFPRIFSPLYVTMVAAGEESGNLKEALADITRHQRRQAEIRGRLRMAVVYPVLMLAFGVGTVVFILTYVMPKITGLFENFRQALPWSTRLVMRVSDGLLHGWPVILAVAAGLVVLTGRFLRSPVGRRILHRWQIRTPVLGPLWMKVETARFCRTLEMLLRSGIPIVRAIQIAMPILGNDVLRRSLDRCHRQLIAGGSFGKSLQAEGLFPPLMGHLISVGEESGTIAETLGDVASAFEEETGEWIKVLTTLMEPLMIVLVGGVVGFVVVAMLLPVFQLDIMAQ